MIAIKITILENNKTMVFTTDTTKSVQKVHQNLYKELLKDKIDTTISVQDGEYAKDLLSTVEKYYPEIEIIKDIKLGSIKKYCKDSIYK